jgi:hypothetical protein
MGSRQRRLPRNNDPPRRVERPDGYSESFSFPENVQPITGFANSSPRGEIPATPHGFRIYWISYTDLTRKRKISTTVLFLFLIDGAL